MIRDLHTETRAYFTVQEVADYVNVPERTIRHHVDKGALIAIRCGALIRISRSSLRAYLGLPPEQGSADARQSLQQTP